MKRIYFHIGYPKTGTTFFQKYLFGDKFFNLGKPYATFNRKKYNQIVNDILDGIFNLDENAFENNKKKFVEKINQLVEFNNTNKPNIISLEAFTNPQNSFKTNISRIKRLIILFNQSSVELKICFFIRNQYDILSSSFLWSILYLYNLDAKLINYKYFIKSIINQNLKIHNYIDCLNYYAFYDEVLNHIKKENLKIFVFEKIISENNFYYDFFNFFNIKIEQKEIDEIKKKIINYNSNKPSWVLNIFIWKNYSNISYLFKNLIKLNFSNDVIKSNIKNQLKIFRKVKTLYIFLRIIFLSKINDDFKIDCGSDEINKIKKIFYKSNYDLDKKCNLNLEKYNYF